MTLTREGNPFWKGGRAASNGYILIRVGTEHPLSDVRGYAYEHRLIAQEKVGRPLRDGEQVHHINGNKQDNSAENLEVVPSAAHHRMKHRSIFPSRLKLPDEPNQMVGCACGCGAKFSRFDKGGRPRKYISGHNPHDESVRAKFLQCVGDGIEIREISAVTGQSHRAVKVMASQLVRAGKLKRLARGYYVKGNRHPVV